MFQEYNLQYLMCLTHCCQVFFYIEGLNRTSIHAQNNQSVLHALWPRRHCATAPSKDTFHGIFAILLFLPQASIHIQSFELHGMKTIPPPKKKTNEHQSVSPQQSCLTDSLIFFWQTSRLARLPTSPNCILGPNDFFSIFLGSSPRSKPVVNSSRCEIPVMGVIHTHDGSMRLEYLPTFTVKKYAKM